MKFSIYPFRQLLSGSALCCLILLAANTARYCTVCTYSNV